MTKSRGFFGIGVYSPRTSENIGTLWRSALNFGASFMFTIGARCGFQDQPSNTTKSDRQIPLYVYPSFKEFVNVLPHSTYLIGVEQCEKSTALETFSHPERAIYLLGSEDKGIPNEVWSYCTGGMVAIDTPKCLNVATAGSIVMYDRHLKQKQAEVFEDTCDFHARNT